MPTEELYQKLEGESLKTLLMSYQKTFKGLWKTKKYAEAYNLTLMTAISERGSAIDETSIQKGLDMLARAISEGDDAVKKLFTVEFKSGLIDSGASLTAQAMVDAIESKSNPMNIALAFVGIGLLAFIIRR